MIKQMFARLLEKKPDYEASMTSIQNESVSALFESVQECEQAFDDFILQLALNHKIDEKDRQLLVEDKRRVFNGVNFFGQRLTNIKSSYMRRKGNE